MEQKPVAFIDARDLEDGFVSASVTKTKQEATDVAVYSETYVRELHRQIAQLKQEVSFLEDWRDVWAPQIKQIQGIKK